MLILKCKKKYSFFPYEFKKQMLVKKISITRTTAIGGVATILDNYLFVGKKKILN